MKRMIKSAVKKLIQFLVAIFPFKKEWLSKAARFVINTVDLQTCKKKSKKSPVSTENLKKRVANPLIEDFCLELSQYDIISFDVFDTLIFRAFPDPKVIFDLWGCKFNLQYGRKMRTDAERELRLDHGDGEVTLSEIYDLLEIHSGIEKSVGMQAEIDLELDYCRPNQFLREVFNRLIELNKRVIILSDMYLPKSVIAKMLEKCGYTGYDALYVSSELKATKASGKIYKLITDIYGDQNSFIQIGDNLISDVENAKKSNWSGYHYRNIHHIGKPFRPDGMSSLGGGLYRGIVNSFLYSNASKPNPYYELGFVYFGILIYGYCGWLNTVARETGAKRILFASRDMYVVEKAYKKCFAEIESNYVSVSRLGIIRADFAKSMEMFFTCLKDAYTTQNQKGGALTIQRYFTSIKFEFIFPLLEGYGVEENTIINDDIFLILRRLICENKPFILENLESDHVSAIKYFSKLLQGNDKAETILFADTNGRCTSLLGIQHIFEDAGLPVKMIGAQMYSVSNKGFVEINLSTGALFTYLFSYLDNRDIYKRFQSKALQWTPSLEAVLTEPKGTLLSYAKGKAEEMQYGPNLNDPFILEQIHNGILDFIDEYHKYAIKISPSFWVSPMDAIRPIEQIADKLPTIFPDLLISMQLGN